MLSDSQEASQDHKPRKSTVGSPAHQVIVFAKRSDNALEEPHLNKSCGLTTEVAVGGGLMGGFPPSPV